MKARIGGALVLAAFAAVTARGADDIKSGPEKKTGGAFNVKAITGGQKGKTLCYV